MTEVTEILSALERGDSSAADKLLPLVYEELRLLAAHRLVSECPGQTLQATALVHEAFLRLVKGEPQEWDSRGHFFAAAAEAMRRILVDNARRKNRDKRGGGWERISLDQADLQVDSHGEDLVALDDALNRLAALDPVKADVVQLRFFAGLTMPEISQALSLSLATVERHWTFARTWLYAEMAGEP